MSTTTYLITGSSRSLGLGYAKELLASSTQTRVVAAVRDPSKADQLEPLTKEFGKDRLYILKCDVNEAVSTQVSTFALFSDRRGHSLIRTPSTSIDCCEGIEGERIFE